MRRPGGFDGGREDDASSPERDAPLARVDRLNSGARPEAAGQGGREGASVPVTGAEPASSSRLQRITRDAATRSPESLERAAQLAAERESDRAVLRAEQELKRAERERRNRERREQRRFTAHSRVRRRRWFVAIGAVLGLALFVAAGVFTPVMAVREIDVQGTQTMNVDDVRAALSRFEGVPLALVDDREVHRALEPFPVIQRYAVERIPPHTLVVRVEERTPVIALQHENGFDIYDPAGVLLATVPERPAGVPLGSAELTDTASPAFVAASTVVRDLPDDIRQQLISVRASNAQDVSFTLASGTEVDWGEAKQTQRKAIVLRAMLASIGSPGLIDVSAPEAPVFK